VLWFVYDASGIYVSYTADNDSGNGKNSSLEFIPEASGTYYINAAGYRDNIGTYTLSVQTFSTTNIDCYTLSRSGFDFSGPDVVFSDGANSNTIKSISGSSVTAALSSGSNATVQASLAYLSSTKAISSQDALDALKLSVGLSTSAGTKNAFDFMSADFNQDGKVSSQDALSILKYSVGLPTSEQAKWVFVDTNGDYSDVSKSNTSYTEGVSIAGLSADTTVSLTGILIGDVNDSYSGLIA
jgi:hypothetical protein